MSAAALEGRDGIGRIPKLEMGGRGTRIGEFVMPEAEV